MDSDKIKIELVRGREGKCICINDYRVAGSKPWGGGYTEYSWIANKDDILKSIRRLDTCRCLKEKDKKEYLGFWLDCECGYKLNTEQAVYCGGCGKKISVIGTIGDRAEF